MAYPGCYALSKVLEEVMLEQFGIQYDTQRLLPARAVDHGEGRFPLHAVLRRRPVRRAGLEDDGAGGRCEALCPERHRAAAARCRRASAETQFRPCRRSGLGDPRGDRQSRAPSASSSTSAWTGRSTTARWRPISRARAASNSIDIPSPFHSNWMDNSKAKYLLGLASRNTISKGLSNSAWEYERSQNDPRVVWYPG